LLVLLWEQDQIFLIYEFLHWKGQLGLQEIITL
jgi:hypothetical protein